MEHHKYQGNEFIDVDLPTDAEGEGGEEVGREGRDGVDGSPKEV